MIDLSHIDAKLDKLLEGQVETRTLVKEIDKRVSKLEMQQSAEKERLDKRFETDVRPLRIRHDGWNFVLKCVGVIGVVLSVVFSGLQIQKAVAISDKPAQEVKPHAQVLPEVRSTPRRRE